MIKCGIIGCGVIAPTHLAGYKAIPGVEVTHFCDLEISRAEKLSAGMPGVRCFTDYREMLQDKELTAVSICTDHASHAAIFCDAIAAGKHVICEKVPGRTHEDLVRMLDTAAQYPEIVATGIFQHRFNPGNIALQNLIREKKFGKLLNVNLNFACLRTDEYYSLSPWRGTAAGEGGGVLINQAIHFLDQLRFLFGDFRRIAAVSANRTHQQVMEVEDTVAFAAELTNGIFVTVTATNSALTRWRSALTICGTGGQAEFIDEKLAYLEVADPEEDAAIRKALENPAEDLQVNGKAYYGTGHTAQLTDFIQAIREKRPPQLSLAEAANSAALVQSVYAAAASGQWIDVYRF